MQLTNKITSAFLLLCLLLSFTFAKGVPDDWGKVKALKSGTSVVLITKQGAEYEGDVNLRNRRRGGRWELASGASQAR